jgi:hypothetical protein
MRFDVGAEDGVHAREVAFAAGSEPFDDIAVETQVHVAPDQAAGGKLRRRSISVRRDSKKDMRSRS